MIELYTRCDILLIVVIWYVFVRSVEINIGVNEYLIKQSYHLAY